MTTASRQSVEHRIAALEQRVQDLEKERSGRKRKPIVVSIDGVCGIDPERDSATCADASLHRRNSGCKGVACKAKSTEYYAEYRK